MNNNNNREFLDNLIKESGAHSGEKLEQFDPYANDSTESTMSDETIDDTKFENSIKLPVSTGEIYFVDPNEFDWENATTNLSRMTENVEALNKTMHDIMINMSKIDSDDLMNKIIDMLTMYLADYQITVNYLQYNPALTKGEVAMLMCHDALNITSIMLNNTLMYDAIKFIGSTDMSATEEEIDDEDDDDNNYKQYDYDSKYDVDEIDEI